MKSAAIYARVSSETQEQEETIQSQLAALRVFASEHGYVVVNEYTDNGWSGESIARPGLDKLRDNVSEKNFDVVLIHSPDRLMRKYVYQEIIREEFQKRGVSLIFLNRPIGDTPEDNMLLGMQGLIAEYEKAKILERTRRGKIHKAKQGILQSGVNIYGFRYIPKTKDQPGRYEIKEEEAEVIRLIFDLCANNQSSTSGIVRELTNRNISPSKGGIKWARSTVRYILRNEAYAGTAYYNKHYFIESVKIRTNVKYRKRIKNTKRLRPQEEWIPIPVPAIISKDLFSAAQKQLQQNQALAPRNNKKYHYLLRGLLRCGNCGSCYHGSPGGGQIYYRCGNRGKMHPLPRTCKARAVRVGVLESLIWENIKRLIQNPRLLSEKIQLYQNNLEQNTNEFEKKIRSLEEKKKTLMYREKRYLDAYEAEIINLDQLKERSSVIKNKITILDEEIKRLKLTKERGMVRDTEILSFEKYCGVVGSTLTKFSFEQKREFLTRIIEDVTILNDTIKIRGLIPITEEPQGNTVSADHNIVSNSPRRLVHNTTAKFAFSGEISTKKLDLLYLEIS